MNVINSHTQKIPHNKPKIIKVKQLNWRIRLSKSYRNNQRKKGKDRFYWNSKDMAALTRTGAIYSLLLNADSNLKDFMLGL